MALPNALHAEWTMRALRAGKAVLCEKPLCASSAQTREVLDVAATADKPLWEAFVFPFQAQHRPFHPGGADTLTITRPGKAPVVERPATRRRGSAT